jgi:hypothetical protein
MKALTLLATMSTLALAAGLSQAADRVHAGQWETTMEVGGQSRVMKTCVTSVEAAEANGDEKAFRASLVKATAGTGCTVGEVKVSGNQVVATSVCGGKQATSTTTYHGDSYDQESSTGTKVHARRVGTC